MTVANKDRMTPAEITEFLTCIGLERLDPREWLLATLPEIFQISGVLAAPCGGIKDGLKFGQSISTNNSDNNINTPDVPKGEVHVYRAVSVNLKAGDLTERVSLRLVKDGITSDIFNDGVVGGPALGPAWLWGAPNINTTAVNSLFPFTIFPGTQGNDHLSVRIQSAAAAQHNVDIQFHGTKYSAHAVGMM